MTRPFLIRTLLGAITAKHGRGCGRWCGSDVPFVSTSICDGDRHARDKLQQLIPLTISIALDSLSPNRLLLTPRGFSGFTSTLLLAPSSNVFDMDEEHRGEADAVV
ncbi:hypothetical protein V8C44DRAFT_191366 [Trichoderma aethiopicum]